MFSIQFSTNKIKFQKKKHTQYKKNHKKEHNELVKIQLNNTLEISIACYKNMLKHISIACYKKVYSTFLSHTLTLLVISNNNKNTTIIAYHANLY